MKKIILVKEYPNEFFFIMFASKKNIFRVYKNKNPDIQIIPTNTNPEIEFMIKRSQK